MTEKLYAHVGQCGCDDRQYDGAECEGEECPVCGEVIRDVKVVPLVDLQEFDAWLSMRGEFREVLDAFRSAFGTDTRA